MLVFCAHQYPPYSVTRFINSCDINTDAPDFAQFLHKNYDTQSKETYAPWATNQAYLALGVAVTTAAQMEIGSCPMSGFVPKDVADILQLPTVQEYLADSTSTLPTHYRTITNGVNANPAFPVNERVTWPVAFLAIGSKHDDAKWHAESRVTWKRRRITLRDLVFWRGVKTTVNERGAVEDVDTDTSAHK